MPLDPNALYGMAGNRMAPSPMNALMPQDPNQVTSAQGWAANTQAAGDYIGQQRAQSVQMGLLDPNTGLPTQAGLGDAAGHYTNMLLMGVKAPNAVAANALMPQQVHPLAGVAQAVRNFMTKPNFARAASQDNIAAIHDAINTHPEIAHAVRSGDWSIADGAQQIVQP